MSNTHSPAIRQVLRALALNREPGWNFPGNLLEMSFDEVKADAATLSIDEAPHCEAAEGGLSLAALCVFADIALAAALRRRVGFAQRMATLRMSLSFPGAPLRGLVRADSIAEGQAQDTTAPNLFTRTTLRGDDGVGCVATGSFIDLGNDEGLSPMPMRKRGDVPEGALLEPVDLTEAEARVLQLAREADTGQPGFLHRFWGFEAGAASSDGGLVLQGGPHVGNRVGHVQGGILLALAAESARRAAGPAWHLTNVTGWYLAPGRGGPIAARAVPLHEGGRTACYQSELRDAEGRLLLRAVTTHARRAD